MPTSQVPTYLEARAAAGHALPSVEVVLPQSDQEQYEEKEERKVEQAGSSGKRKAAGEDGDATGAEAWEEEKHAVLEYVVTAMNEELITELLEGFHSEK
jgi:hypothetical protein